MGLSIILVAILVGETCNYSQKLWQNFFNYLYTHHCHFPTLRSRSNEMHYYYITHPQLYLLHITISIAVALSIIHLTVSRVSMVYYTVLIIYWLHTHHCHLPTPRSCSRSRSCNNSLLFKYHTTPTTTTHHHTNRSRASHSTSRSNRAQHNSCGYTSRWDMQLQSEIIANFC